MNDHRSKADPWWYGTWEGNREARLDAALAATPAQRLAWLEDALYFAFQATRRFRPPVASVERQNPAVVARGSVATAGRHARAAQGKNG